MHKCVKAETNMLFLLCLTSFTHSSGHSPCGSSRHGSAELQRPLGTRTALGTALDSPSHAAGPPGLGGWGTGTGPAPVVGLRPRESHSESPARPSAPSPVCEPPSHDGGGTESSLPVALAQHLLSPGGWHSKGGGQEAQHKVQVSPYSSCPLSQQVNAGEHCRAPQVSPRS